MRYSTIKQEYKLKSENEKNCKSCKKDCNSIKFIFLSKILTIDSNIIINIIDQLLYMGSESNQVQDME